MSRRDREGNAVTARNTSIDASTCGICGQLQDARHDRDGHGAGRRVEYVVVGTRGGLAEFREADAGSRLRKTDAAVLALNLGVEESGLPGRRFSCLVVPDEYGVTRSDFRLA
ncbi:hypothetical protein [Micromonospora tulbaghiae]|uniref:hypothetical protein n=1 Tax=Micromonospora tulbaghiae TaxID=479978 RepID=UPI0029C2C1D2|nr:hypothetical protein [Micromonospora tulbaghiae]MDX5458120.1 hypothetical protein [Micromonospora tulbaghiae]